MRAAADGEDGSVKHVAMENRLYPLRELLAELLLEMGQPTAALAEYEAALKGDPQPLSRVLGRGARCGCGRRPAEGLGLFHETRGAVEERRYRTARDPGGTSIPGEEMKS